MSGRNATNIGQTFRVSDCYVWSEITYLDSATDYREYLPKLRTHAARAPTVRSDLVLLDSSKHLCRWHACLCMASLVLFLIICCAFLYELL